MKFTKFVHSCLLVEHEGKKVLIDPGDYSWNSGVVDELSLKEIDYVLVTHPHEDHISTEFAKVVSESSPNAVWYVTPATQKILADLPVKTETVSENIDVKFIKSEHADLTYWNTCEDHTSFLLFDDILVSGDCHTLPEMYGASIFAVAINGGPWGSVKTFLNMLASMNEKPSKVLPLHDWHWNDQARAGIYKRLEWALNNFDVEFVPMVDGQPVEL